MRHSRGNVNHPEQRITENRYLTFGETWESALQELRDLPSVQRHGAQVSMYTYERPSYTGLVYPIDCYFPTWVIPEDAAPCRAVVAAWRGLYQERCGEPRVDKWTFSTNGVSIMGRNGIPCIGGSRGSQGWGPLCQRYCPLESSARAPHVGRSDLIWQGPECL